MSKNCRSRRSLSNRIALGSSLAGLTATLAFGYMSMLATVMFAAGDWLVGIRLGNMVVKRMPNSNVGRAFGILEFWPIEGGKVYDILVQSGGRFPPATVDVTIPLWPLLAILIVATVLLWRQRRPRPKVGQCPCCRYDLTGNVSGQCPECGTVVVTPAALAMRFAAAVSAGEKPRP